MSTMKLELAKALRDINKKRRTPLSLQTLAKQTGISKPYLSQIFGGKRQPSKQVMRQLVDALRIPEPNRSLLIGLASENKNHIKTSRVQQHVTRRSKPHPTRSVRRVSALDAKASHANCNHPPGPAAFFADYCRAFDYAASDFDVVTGLPTADLEAARRYAYQTISLQIGKPNTIANYFMIATDDEHIDQFKALIDEFGARALDLLLRGKPEKVFLVCAGAAHMPLLHDNTKV